MSTTYVGKSVARVDGQEKVTGRAVYTVDVNLPGMLHAAVLRSPLPHARLVEVDLEETRKMPGVRVALTGRDFPRTFGNYVMDQPILAIDRVRYVGEPVVAVAADTELQAQAALAKVRVKYDELPAVFDPREAMGEGAPLLHPEVDKYPHAPGFDGIPGTNIAKVRTYSLGDIAQGFGEADEIFEDEFYIHAVAHSPMETHAAVVQYFAGKKQYDVWSSTDRPFTVGKQMVDAFGLKQSQVHFLSMYCGGSFGGKGAPVAEVIAAALATFSNGRPVKLVYSREEELTASQTRHPAFLKLKTGMKKDGSFTARRAEVLWDNGAYCSAGPSVANRGVLTVFGPYRIPNLELLSRLVYTNKQVGGAYRGFGTTQATWACETQMDIMAAKLGIDPLELRRKNAYVNGDAYINGQRFCRIGITETLVKASQQIGWGQPKPAPAGSKIRGKGLASTIKPTITPTSSYCFIHVNGDGTLSVLSSSPEIGAGEKTVMAQIAAETIGVPLASIVVPNPDTHYTPYDNASASSRATFHMGNAVLRASKEVRQKILEFAGKQLKTDPGLLNLHEGKILDASGKELLTLEALLTKAFGLGGAIIGEGQYRAAESPSLAATPGLEFMSSVFWMFATHAAEVEVDTETGMVKVLKVAAAHDVGRAINPALCEQQIEGAVVMGLSNTLFEEFQLENGRVLNDGLSDYKLATTMDIPEIVPILVETMHEEGPYGAKGIGEPAAAPTAPAIANAIYDAIGVRIKDLPITPEKILLALKNRS